MASILLEKGGEGFGPQFNVDWFVPCDGLRADAAATIILASGKTIDGDRERKTQREGWKDGDDKADRWVKESHPRAGQEAIKWRTNSDRDAVLKACQAIVDECRMLAEIKAGTLAVVKGVVSDKTPVNDAIKQLSSV